MWETLHWVDDSTEEVLSWLKPDLHMFSSGFHDSCVSSVMETINSLNTKLAWNKFKYSILFPDLCLFVFVLFIFFLLWFLDI